MKVGDGKNEKSDWMGNKEGKVKNQIKRITG